MNTRMERALAARELAAETAKAIDPRLSVLVGAIHIAANKQGEPSMLHVMAPARSWAKYLELATDWDPNASVEQLADYLIASVKRAIKLEMLTLDTVPLPFSR